MPCSHGHTAGFIADSTEHSYYCVLTTLVACLNGHSFWKSDHKWDKNPGAAHKFHLLKFWFLHFQCSLLDATVCELIVIPLKNNAGLLKGSSCNILWLSYILIHYPYLYLLMSLPHLSLSFPSSLSLWALNWTAQSRNRSRLSFNIDPNVLDSVQPIVCFCSLAFDVLPH